MNNKELAEKYLQAARCNNKRAARYKDKMQKLGFRRLNLWVHKDDCSMIKAFAQEATDKRKEKQDD